MELTVEQKLEGRELQLSELTSRFEAHIAVNKNQSDRKSLADWFLRYSENGYTLDARTLTFVEAPALPPGAVV